MSDFLSGYKTYDPNEKGYGNASSWRRDFYKRLSPEEAILILNEQDPYEILGIERGVSIVSIKKAFRKLALRWHPDKNPNDLEKATAMMKKLNAAYSLLIK